MEKSYFQEYKAVEKLKKKRLSVERLWLVEFSIILVCP
jgi:hypothetical protein